jgi:chorismate mutase
MNPTVMPPERFALAALLAGCAGLLLVFAPVRRESDPEYRILEVMRQRLAVMPEVARWKWNRQAPVTDPAREKELLVRLRTHAQEQGLDPDDVERFFSAQFAAAKQIQEAEFRRWQSVQQEPFAVVPDLKTEIRPTIDRINRELLQLLKPAPRFRSTRLVQLATTVLTGPGITPAVRSTALQPLLLLAQP